MLRVLEARAALEAVEVDRGAAEADEVDAARHAAHARGLPSAAGRGGGSQIFAPGFIVHACSAVNSGHVVGLAGQVADHPGVVHAVAGRGDLRMVVAGQDPDRVVLAHLEDVVAVLGVAETLRVREAVVVDLRLRMVVRRVARPAAGQRDDLAEHEADLGRRVARVEDRAHEPQAASADLAFAAALVGDVGRAGTRAA